VLCYSEFNILAIYLPSQPPTGHQPPELHSSYRVVSVLKVAVPSVSRKGSFIGGEGIDGSGGGGDADELDPPPKVGMLGNNPPALGGAVTPCVAA
jgi:hypothetical protein